MAKEIYEIIKDGFVFGSFQQGDKSRFDGEKFDRKVASKEFDDCVKYWRSKGDRSEWALRIRLPNAAS